MPAKHLSRDRLVALGELKNLAGFVIDQVEPRLGRDLVAALALRMEAIIDGSSGPIYKATPKDVADMLVTAKLVKRGRAAYADS